MCWLITSTGDSLHRRSKSEQVRLFNRFLVGLGNDVEMWRWLPRSSSPSCRHWSGVLRLRGDRRREGSSESRTRLLHGGHAHQGSPSHSHEVKARLPRLKWVSSCSFLLYVDFFSNCKWDCRHVRSWQINLIAPPRYVMTTTTLERTEGLSVLNQAMAAIKEKIEEKRGVFNIQMEVSDFTYF